MGKNSKEELKNISKFLHTNRNSAIILRRAFNKSRDRIQAKEQFAFLEATSEVKYLSAFNEENWFVITLVAKQLDIEGSYTRMENVLNDIYHDTDASESTKKRIAKLLEKKPQYQLNRELAWFVKYANKRNIKIDEYALYEDLLNWKQTAFHWAKKIVRKKGEN